MFINYLSSKFIIFTEPKLVKYLRFGSKLIIIIEPKLVKYCTFGSQINV